MSDRAHVIAQLKKLEQQERDRAREAEEATRPVVMLVAIGRAAAYATAVDIVQGMAF